uniref:Uncharacterized protein n=1 Tax=Nelumbo nucifera TaxID=4432 RepID=A0A822XN36_NELNU|nr:TPA_asm: hypothetical protein HUJ06_023273 [Nelumbo nucifera]
MQKSGKIRNPQINALVCDEKTKRSRLSSSLMNQESKRDVLHCDDLLRLLGGSSSLIHQRRRPASLVQCASGYPLDARDRIPSQIHHCVAFHHLMQVVQSGIGEGRERCWEE